MHEQTVKEPDRVKTQFEYMSCVIHRDGFNLASFKSSL